MEDTQEIYIYVSNVLEPLLVLSEERLMRQPLFKVRHIHMQAE